MTSTFCRHNRFVENCPICSKKARVQPGTVEGKAAARSEEGARRTSPAEARRSAATAARSAPRKRTARSSDLVVRRVARAADDGYASDLVPGLRASDDARRLAAELAWSAARLEELGSAPPAYYAELSSVEPEEAFWRLFLVSVLAPLEGVDDAFAAIRAAHVPWSSGELPALDEAELGPRSALQTPPVPGRKPRRLPAVDLVSAYRAWAERSGGQLAGFVGETGWDAGRRFDRAYERLALPHFGRVPRYELVTLAGALGLVDATAASLQLSDPASAVVGAAKRVFGIGDPLLLARRAHELGEACAIPIGAFDLALQNWAVPPEERITAGSGLAEDPAPERRAAAERALGV